MRTCRNKEEIVSCFWRGEECRYGYIAKDVYRDRVYVEGNIVYYYLHRCPIAEYDMENRTLKIRTCNWYTRTTEDRLNLILPHSMKIQQINGEWYIIVLNDNLEFYKFYDNMIVDLKTKTFTPSLRVFPKTEIARVGYRDGLVAFKHNKEHYLYDPMYDELFKYSREHGIYVFEKKIPLKEVRKMITDKQHRKILREVMLTNLYYQWRHGDYTIGDTLIAPFIEYHNGRSYKYLIVTDKIVKVFEGNITRKNIAKAVRGELGYVPTTEELVEIVSERLYGELRHKVVEKLIKLNPNLESLIYSIVTEEI